MKGAIKDGKQYFSRSNHIKFNIPRTQTDAELDNCKNAIFGIDVFSGVEEAINLKLILQTKPIVQMRKVYKLLKMQ